MINIPTVVAPGYPISAILKINKDICSSRCTTGENDTGGKLEICLNWMFFSYFVQTLLDSNSHLQIYFFTKCSI